MKWRILLLPLFLASSSLAAPFWEEDAAVTTTKEATTSAGGGDTTTQIPESTAAPTTEGPKIDFARDCTAKQGMCTYSMEVPGLNLDMYNRLINTLTDDNKTVHNFDLVVLPTMQQEATQMLSQVDEELVNITASIDNLSKEIENLVKLISALNSAKSNIETNIVKSELVISWLNGPNGRSSCYNRKCIDKVTVPPTTTKPVTTTTTPPSPCAGEPCLNNGTCVVEGRGFYCECPAGNLNGDSSHLCEDTTCEAAEHGNKVLKLGDVAEIYSPGWNTTAEEGGDHCSFNATCSDAASWTIQGNTTTIEYLLVDGVDSAKVVSTLDAANTLFIYVDTYKLKITSKTTVKQANLILKKGPAVRIEFKGTDCFNFKIKGFAKTLLP